MASEQQYLKDRRLELHEKLVQILGSRNVYFQPPESLKMQYPCIIYERYGMLINTANNAVYTRGVQYRVTVVDTAPDSIVVDKLSKSFATIKFNRHYVVDGLNHDIFTIYY